MSRQRLDSCDQNGLASLVIVSVLVVLLTLISLGFARLMSRSYVSSTNRQLSNSATYAAQSGINDVVDYMKQYATDHPSDPYVASPECTGTNSLIGSSAVKGPFYFDSNLSNDASRNTSFTCILLDQTPTSLIYNAIPPLQSRVVKLTTSAFPGSFNSIMLSWQATNQTLINSPPAAPTLYDETSWNNSNYTPMLRVTIYPVPYSGATNDIQANSRTIYLYPQPDSGGVIALRNYNSVDPVTGLPNGSVLPVSCTSTSNPAFNGKPDYRCNLIISSLLQSVTDPSGDPLNYIYVRITPIYGQADVEIRANDTFRQPLRFVGVQAVVDVTAKTSNVSKRLQARVNIGDETSDINDNISPNSNDLPEFGIRSADALCKQLTVHHSYFDYITLDGSTSTVCNTSPNIVIPAPSLTFTITGNNGRDDGLTVDSEANNPDLPQNPIQKGTVYLGNSPADVTGAATLNWRTSDATSCVASGGWGGQVLDNPPFNTTWSGARSQGSQGVSQGTITNYVLTCLGPGSSAPLVKQVTAWPYPRITNLYFSPSTVHAGDSYSINWNSINSDRCDLQGSWPSGGMQGPNGSETYTWPWWDNSSTRTYRVTCSDPIGRSDTSWISINTSGGGSGGNGAGGGGLILPPTCHASAAIVDNGDGTGNYSWNGTCPDVSPGNGYYMLYTTADYTSGDDSRGCWVGASGLQNNDDSATCSNGGSYLVHIDHPGDYCFGFRSGVDPWGWQASDYACGHVRYPPVSLFFWVDGPHYQYPECDSPGNWFDKTWWCGGGDGSRYAPGVCADGVHTTTICGAWWTATQNYGTVVCDLFTNGGVLLKATAGSPTTSGSIGRVGWTGPAALSIQCNGLDGQSTGDFWGWY